MKPSCQFNARWVTRGHFKCQRLSFVKNLASPTLHSSLCFLTPNIPPRGGSPSLYSSLCFLTPNIPPREGSPSLHSSLCFLTPNIPPQGGFTQPAFLWSEMWSCYLKGFHPTCMSCNRRQQVLVISHDGVYFRVMDPGFMSSNSRQTLVISP